MSGHGVDRHETGDDKSTDASQHSNGVNDQPKTDDAGNIVADHDVNSAVTTSGPVVVTKYGRHVKMTEKATGNFLNTKYAELKQSCRQWEKQYAKLKELLTDHADITVLRRERYNLTQQMSDINKRFQEIRDVEEPQQKTIEEIQSADQFTQDLVVEVNNCIEAQRVSPSLISNLPQLLHTRVSPSVTSEALTQRSTSSKSSKRRQKDLALAKELEVKLKFMDEEAQINQKIAELSRRQKRLETERQMHEARARASAYLDDEQEQSLCSDDVSSSIHQRVNDYVMKQNPSYDVTEDQFIDQQDRAYDRQTQIHRNTAPVDDVINNPPEAHSNPANAHAHADSQAFTGIAASQPYAPLFSTVHTQDFAPASNANRHALNARPQPSADRSQPAKHMHSKLDPNAASYVPGTHKPVDIPPSAEESTPKDSIGQLAHVLQQQMSMTQLPPPEPGVFSGDPLQFNKWLTSFEQLIESRPIAPAQRLHYLERYLSGEAKQCVENYVVLSTDMAYYEAKAQLKKRYGETFIVANAFRKKLDDWPRIHGTDGKGLQKLADFLKQCESAMKVNNYLKVLDDCKENQSILKKLPDWIVNRWARQANEWKKKKSEFPPFTEFVRFLSEEAEIATDPVTATCNLRGASSKRYDGEPRAKKHVGATATAAKPVSDARQKNSVKQENTKSTDDSTERKRKPCILCSGDHHLNSCEDFLKKTLVERQQYVKENRLCYCCFKPYHRSKDCKHKMRCKTCQKPHPTSMHDDDWKPRDTEQGQDRGDKEKATVAKIDTNSSQYHNATSMIVPVYVSSSKNPRKEELVYAMLDTQSDASFITDRTCDRLGIDGPATELLLTTMSSDEEVVHSRKMTGLVARPYNGDSKVELPVMFSTPEVPGNLSNVPTQDTARQWQHLQPIVQHMPPLLNLEIGLLIGYNCSEALTPREVIASKNKKEPYAQKTDLGWCIVGTNVNEATDGKYVCHRTTATVPQGRASIVCKVKAKEVFKPTDFLKLSDAVFHEYPEEKKTSYEDYVFMKKLTDGIHEKDGHYEMPLPFKKGDIRLPDNKPMAVKRLQQLKRRLQSDKVYRDDYEKFMKEIIDKGFCESVPQASEHATGRRWFIPHHGVYHPKKPGKIRVVFDCSAKYNGVSLNDTLLQGPDMINDLIGVLCRFRKEAIAISCDIEKMFYQFSVNEEDRNFLSFLWWKDGKYDTEPQEYRMTVHLFGAVSSPGCANFGLNKAADDGEAEFGTAAANFVRHNFYVDDGITSVPTVEEGVKLVKNTVQLCASKGLRLHKFVSNSSDVLETVAPKERAIEAESLRLDHEQHMIERTLGLEWCVRQDCFQFKIVLKDRPPTRRGILSTVYSLYDPLGFLSPVILVGRQILQEICKQHHDWDAPLPEDIIKRWQTWKQSLIDLQQIRISRCYKPMNFTGIATAQLHHFSDASTEGYGQCSYLRLVDKTGKIHCSLVMAKARVAPLKQVTIPRLELAAAVLSVRVGSMLMKVLQYENLEEFYWSDSKVVLGYISNEAKRFHTYVANRIQQIRNHTEPGQWNYVSTQENPADFVSRGLSVRSLLEKTNWLNGPDFLWQQDLQTSTATDHAVHIDDPELKRSVLATTGREKDTSLFLQKFERFSNWTALKRAVSMCLRLKDALRHRARGEGTWKIENTTVEDLRLAETEIIKLVQKQAFNEELAVFTANDDKRKTQRKLKRKHVLYNLDPYVDRKGILRIGGRIHAASLANEIKHPAVLPKSSHVAKLIALQCHENTHHQGRGMTMNQIRMSGYWIIGCRSVVASVIDKCVQCKRFRGSLLTQKMADLPKDRVEPSKPFAYSAVDYFGPFYIKERRSLLKRYGVLFTCLASRAIHIETANSMDTDSFINALRRFISIRGKVRQLRSDMGTNFIGAKNEFQQEHKLLNQERIRQHLLIENCDYIEHRFNVPHASHMGGVWERQIRSVRSILSSLMHNAGQQLDDESLRTLMYETMAIVNSRPLSVVNMSDSTSPEPLTPNHLLYMDTQVVLPPPGEFQQEDMYSRKRWRRVQHLLNEFWSRWQAEYLQNLQPRQKWCDASVNLCKGDIVIVKEENLPRNKWLLARVDDTLPSSDNKVRKVKLRISTRSLDAKGKRKDQPSFLERPIHKLVVLCKDRSTIPPESHHVQP